MPWSKGPIDGDPHSECIDVRGSIRGCMSYQLDLCFSTPLVCLSLLLDFFFVLLLIAQGLELDLNVITIILFLKDEPFYCSLGLGHARVALMM